MKISLSVLASVAVLACAGPVLAQSISVPLTGASPQATFPKFRNGIANCTVNNPQLRSYELRTLTVGTTGNYTFSDTGDGDAILGIYNGSFNVADPTQNCVVGVDDGGGSTPNGNDVTLNAGTYTVMFGNYSDTTAMTATYNYIGPGVLSVGPLAVPPVPTMTEWAMILFGTVLAGSAALYIQRRRQSF